MHINIESVLPENRVERGLVLEARRLLRHRIRTSPSSRERAQALTLLFDVSKRSFERLLAAADSTDPVQSAARELAGGKPSVSFGHGELYVHKCRFLLQERKSKVEEYNTIVARDAETLTTLSRAADLARSSSPVVISGEPGTGKSLLAAALHRRSKRPGAFVTYHAQSQSLAKALEDAHNGTLFINEICELQNEQQKKLLDAIELAQTSEDSAATNDARLVIATRTSLTRQYEHGRIRSDLFFQLNADPLHLPRLNEREGFFDRDLDDFLANMFAATDWRVSQLARDALRFFNWPGNLRELGAVLRQASELANGQMIRLENLPGRIRDTYMARPIRERSKAYVLNDEEVSAESFSEELIGQRVQRLLQLVVRVPAPSEQDGLLLSINNLESLLASMPDDSKEHEANVQALRSTSKKLSDRLRVGRAIRFLKSQDYARDNPVVLSCMERHLRDLFAEHDRLRSSQNVEFRSIERAFNSPWLRLALYVKQVDSTLSASGSESREMSRDERERLALLRSQIDQLDSDLYGTLPFTSRSHKTWTRDEWLRLVEACRSKSDACRRTRLHERTITRYLRKYEIPENWGRINS